MLRSAWRNCCRGHRRNSGIGFGVTRRLAAGAEVILAVRNLDKGNQAISDLLAENPQARLSLEWIDLSSLQSVKDFAARLNEGGRPINTLINNAGIMAPADLPNSQGCPQPPGFLPGPRIRTLPGGSGRSLSGSRRCIFPQRLSLLRNYMPVSMALRHKDDR